MKICVLTHTYPKFKNDVCAPFMGELCENLQALGHEVTVLTPYTPEFDWKPPQRWILKPPHAIHPYRRSP